MSDVNFAVAAAAMLLGGSAASAQYTEQWSTAPKTEQWSMPSAPPAPPPPAPPAPRSRDTAPPSSGQWSAPTYTQQVDPKRMEHPEIVARPGPIERRLVGNWNLWVPGGIWYSSDGSTVYRNYTPGAAINRLRIAADGRYVWGNHRGHLVEIKPWFANPGERYFAVQMDANNRYMARYDARTGKLNLFFWGVGGHAATGERG